MNCKKCEVRLNWGVAEILVCPKCNDIFREIIKPNLPRLNHGSQTEEE